MLIKDLFEKGYIDYQGRLMLSEYNGYDYDRWGFSKAVAELFQDILKNFPDAEYKGPGRVRLTSRPESVYEFDNEGGFWHTRSSIVRTYYDMKTLEMLRMETL